MEEKVFGFETSYPVDAVVKVAAPSADDAVMKIMTDEKTGKNAEESLFAKLPDDSFATNSVDIGGDDIVSEEVLADGTRIFGVRLYGLVTLMHFGHGRNADEAFEEIRGELIDENEQVKGEWEEPA